MLKAFETTFSTKQVLIIKELHKRRSASVPQLTFLLYPEVVPDGYPESLTRVSNLNKCKTVSAEVTKLFRSGIIIEVDRDFRTLEKKDERGFVRQVFRYSTIYTLSEFGLKIAQSDYFLSIPFGYTGTGWNNDQGHFSYNLFTPPTKQSDHHRYGVDANILFNKSCKQLAVGFDFRDNRYCKISYVNESKSAKSKVSELKPDGEIKFTYHEIATKHFMLPPNWSDLQKEEALRISSRNDGTDVEKASWLEIDMRSEDVDDLTNKFAGYARAYDHYVNGISRSKLDIPDNIFFLSTAVMMEWRFRATMIPAILRGLGTWSTHLNVYLGGLNDIESLVKSRCMEESTEQLFLHNIRGLTDPREHSFSKDVFVSWVENLSRYDILGTGYTDELKSEMLTVLGYLPKFVIHYDKRLNRKTLFLFERLNGLETRGICRTIRFRQNYAKILYLSTIHEVIPVFYYDEQRPDINFDYTEYSPLEEGKRDPNSVEIRKGHTKMYETKLSGYFEKVIWHSTSDNRWFDKNYKAPTTRNPLLTYME
ncbi:hypothetical protein [Paenibacillus sp. FSL P4-0288]|uniref:hypothetical protein n=1 Tax=Paenibacillus sp. FSL P4-0288 TaxID=2921633 RepID=UPI0030F814E8